ncbi:BA14K family protein [Ensifer sp. MJa1]|uniref:BA14K family protein n=1 Tax=Ensifer sp. MJa1 TaxID=2919888 RepID=UPI0030093BED
MTNSMKSGTGRWIAPLMAAAVLLTSAAPSQAFVPAPPQVEQQNNAVNVQYRRPGMERRGGYYYYNGYRGYNYRRPGYRYYNGWWYPMAAFGAGVVIVQPPRYTRPAPVYGSRHVQWCYDRYRSYRAYDNTYQPYGGPRQQCYSPYS